MMKHVIMEGFMGSGKSTIGKKLAKALDVPFMDLDKMITAKMNMSVLDIFEKYGEPYFRAMETYMLSELLNGDAPGGVLSIGGGVPTMPQNAPYLKKLGVVVYLQVEPEVLVARLENDDSRPLLKGHDDLLEYINHTLEEREPSYKKVANITVKTNDRKISEVVAEVQKLVEKKLGTAALKQDKTEDGTKKKAASKMPADKKISGKTGSTKKETPKKSESVKKAETTRKATAAKKETPVKKVAATKRSAAAQRATTEKNSASVKKAVTAKKAASTKKTTPAKKTTAVKKTTPAKRTAAVKKTAPVKKTAAVKKAAPAKKTAAVKKAAPAKRTAAVKKAAPAKKTAAVKKAAPAKKTTTAKKGSPAKKSSAAKKAASAKKVAPAKRKAVTKKATGWSSTIKKR